ncbi:MAG: D-glycero-beta-D-manno-heptose 1-phosphate adenylyltransferase [Gemmatimonadota bacterium]
MSQPIQPQAKIFSREQLRRMCSRPREQALVFTNGVFDVVHRGHVEYLYAARALGDALVVALNSDASARRLGKGTDRPINREQDRALVVAALGCVDYVTLFAEDTPRSIVAELLPDVLVKGGDYPAETIVGRAEVEAAGGRVVVIPLVHGHSTTELLNRIRENS